MTTQRTLESRLQHALLPSALEIINESHKHAGHAGVAGNETGDTHFKVVIVSDAFLGKSRVQRHQAVYAAVGDLMDNPIHALAIDARSE